MRKIITASFFTTVNKMKAAEALNFFLPWNWSKWSNGEYVKKLLSAVKKYIGLKYAVSFYQGRDALQMGFKALGISPGDEVILQAFTCVSVPNAIKACGARPVYADIIGSSKFKVQSSKFFDYNINPVEIEKKITSRAKAVLVQHTFGLPAEMDQIIAICRRHNLYLIEDCAHALGSMYQLDGQQQKAGLAGDIAIFSFGRDKIISSGAGGLLATNNNQIYQQIKQVRQVNKTEILRCLLYEIIFYVGKILYPFYIGKIIVWLAQKLAVTSKILTKQEKSGQIKKQALGPLPNALAKLAYLDFLQLERYKQRRRQIAEIYYQGLKDKAEIVLPYNPHQSEAVFLRFALQVREPQKLYEYMKKRGILLSNWYSHIIDPAGVDLARVGYRLGECPQAEQAALGVVNLPVHQNMGLKDALFVIQSLESFYKKK